MIACFCIRASSAHGTCQRIMDMSLQPCIVFFFSSRTVRTALCLAIAQCCSHDHCPALRHNTRTCINMRILHWHANEFMNSLPRSHGCNGLADSHDESGTPQSLSLALRRSVNTFACMHRSRTPHCMHMFTTQQARIQSAAQNQAVSAKVQVTVIPCTACMHPMLATRVCA